MKSSNKRVIDEQEKLIIKELIKNPRISDNQISRNTNVPLKTVNTKRKKLEKEGIIKYYTMIDNSSYGTGLFSSQQIYKVTLKEGVTRKNILEKLPEMSNNIAFRKHLFMSFLAEENGKVVVYFIIESYNDKDIIEIFNAEIVPFIKNNMGDVILKTETSTFRMFVRMFHNYVNDRNIDNIFVYE